MFCNQDHCIIIYLKCLTSANEKLYLNIAYMMLQAKEIRELTAICDELIAKVGH